MFTLALRNILRHRLRTGVTLGAIAFGVTGLVLSGGFVADIFIQLGEAVIHSQSGHLQVAKQGYFAEGSRSPERYRIDNAQPLRDIVRAQPGVSEAMARLSFAGLLSNGRSDLAIVGEGVEAAPEARLGTFMRIIAGRQLGPDDAFGILLGQGVASALKLAPGDPVTLVTSTAEGALNSLEFEVVGVFQTFAKDFDDRAVRIALPAAQELVGTAGVNTLVIALEHTEDTDAAAAALRARLAGTGLELRTWVELNDFYSKTVDLYQRQFGVLRLIVLFMVLLSVANSVNMSVFERTGEFGTMQALGNRQRQVMGLVITENALLGALGAGLGVVLGVALAQAISAVGIPMPPPPNANQGYTAMIRVLPGELLLAFVIGLAATIAAAILPARRVARRPIVDALRENV